MATTQPSGKVSVSAFFDSEAKVEAALGALELRGIPRDLIEVGVSAQAATRFYPGLARPKGGQVFRFAGAGAGIGLTLSALLSLSITVLPGYAPPGLQSVVQLLGPNVGTVTGAMAGAIIGLFVRERPRRAYARALERPEILLMVHERPAGDARAVAELLRQAGGSDPVIG